MRSVPCFEPGNSKGKQIVTDHQQKRGDEDRITIVSGLPRSGTSLMMQMLQAGGIGALTDHVRAADDDNPRGYWEYEAVKRTKQDASWLADAPGKVVKMVHLLLYDLPPDRFYRVLFMQRDLREVVQSQSAMLERLGRKGASLTDDELSAAFEEQLAKIGRWLDEQPNFTALTVDYNTLLEHPEPITQAIDEFVGGGLDTKAMCAVIDPSLYRQRRPGV